MKINDIVSLYKESEVILDINHPGQNGLTMRTFEALGAGKKLITTNTEIKKLSELIKSAFNYKQINKWTRKYNTVKPIINTTVTRHDVSAIFYSS